PNIFTGSNNLKKVTFEDGITVIPASILAGTSVEEIQLPSSVETIDSYAFSDSSLREVVFPLTLTKIGSSAFSGTQLTTVTLPAGLTHLGDYAFGNISSLTSINIPKDINSDRNYYASYSPFSGSSTLTQISFDEGITVIPDYLFKDLS
ncbi:leucine-rich repeat domain-containing protein, partial [Streptococcus suis]|uniref:leucine-rich repeat domain-containing protein n=1 Tax=Streptococcus suis TaxID=1307 RepID=UPI0012907485